ncbi:hypothetical protein SAMN04488574_15315 [Bacillus sp. 71mf]|nr:hypothetical protein SAMN04488574_15315 [Bacillus sp. 71mf]SFT23433.1 hypothetical protein SAMN04488145_12915 [Bacillus sp. 103mf]
MKKGDRERYSGERYEYEGDGDREYLGALLCD